MSSVTASLQNLVSSFLDIIKAIFQTFYSAFETVFATASGLISSIVDLMSGLIGFILGKHPHSCTYNSGFQDANVCICASGNIVIIGLLIAAFVGYSAYQQKQGRNKKGQTKKLM